MKFSSLFQLFLLSFYFIWFLFKFGVVICRLILVNKQNVDWRRKRASSELLNKCFRYIYIYMFAAFGCWENGHISLLISIYLIVRRVRGNWCAGYKTWRMGTVVRRFGAIISGHSSISGEQSLASHSYCY